MLEFLCYVGIPAVLGAGKEENTQFMCFLPCGLELAANGRCLLPIANFFASKLFQIFWSAISLEHLLTLNLFDP